MHDPVGAKGTGRAQVERLANRRQELRGHGWNAVPGKEPGHDLHRPLLDLPPGPGVALLHVEGLVPGLLARGGLRQRLDQHEAQNFEPGLHGLRAAQ
eukprot:scaffold291315_cov47-Attheya_sp.AAC.3